MWAGSLIPLSAALVIVADEEARIAEAQLRLARVGLENVKGYLLMDAWREAQMKMAVVPQISVAKLRELIQKQADLQLIDVRRPAEYQSGHAPQARLAPLQHLRELLPRLNLEPSELTAIICAGGFRSSAAASIMQQAGFTNVMNVNGGTNAWVDAGYEVEKPV